MRLIALAALFCALPAAVLAGRTTPGSGNVIANAPAPPLTPEQRAAGEKLINQFIDRYVDQYTKYQKQTETAASELSALIDRTSAFIVPPELSSRTKAPASLRGKLQKAMEGGSLRPQNIQDVEAAAFDVIGMRITAFAPSLDLPLIEGLLNKSFVMTRWKRGDPNGRYPGNNYLGSTGGINIEIQTRGALDHAFLQLEHKVRYKPKKGYELTAAQNDMLEKFRNDVEASKASLAAFVGAFRAAHPVQAQPAFREESLSHSESEVSSSLGAWTTHYSSSEEEIFEGASEYFQSMSSDEQQGDHQQEAEKSAFRRSDSGNNLLRTNN